MDKLLVYHISTLGDLQKSLGNLGKNPLCTGIPLLSYRPACTLSGHRFYKDKLKSSINKPLQDMSELNKEIQC